MARDPDSDPVIEVEVLEIDGKVAPPPNLNTRSSPARRRDTGDADESASGRPWTNWQRWPGQVRTLHPLWWPVIIVVGGIVLTFVLAVGLVVAFVVIIFRILRALFR